MTTSSPHVASHRRSVAGLVHCMSVAATGVVDRNTRAGECYKAGGMRGINMLYGPIAHVQGLKIDEVLSMRNDHDNLGPPNPPRL